MQLALYNHFQNARSSFQSPKIFKNLFKLPDASTIILEMPEVTKSYGKTFQKLLNVSTKCSKESKVFSKLSAAFRVICAIPEPFTSVSNLSRVW